MSCYWGAYMEGKETYKYHYGGVWSNAPWDTNTWNKFESNAGKRASLVSFGIGAPWDHYFTYFQKSAFDKIVAVDAIPVCNCQSYNENLADITKGKYYAELQRWAAGEASWSNPFFFLPCVEANGNWQPWSPGHNGNTVEGFV